MKLPSSPPPCILPDHEATDHVDPATAIPPWARRRWRNIGAADWEDWQWQQQNRIRTAADLSTVIQLTDGESEACTRAGRLFAMAITPYYASLMDPHDATDPIRRQAVPSLAELRVRADEREDPLAEDSHMPVAGLTHRYPDRVLIYSTHNCPVYCRHCNRKRKVGDPETAAPRSQLRAAVDYIAAHSEVRDVLVSGGDPLTYSDERLDELLGWLRAIPHLEIIRIATRNPVTLPQRITGDLCSVLRRHHPIFVNTHFNHLRECTPRAAQALSMLADSGCVLGNQMVLLKGINEDPAMVKRMNQWLLAHRCRPYYIFQCDPAHGISHFRTPLSSGIAILSALRGHTSGLAVPHYVVDLPGGGGKVPVQPEYFKSRDGKTLTFENYVGQPYTYDEG